MDGQGRRKTGGGGQFRGGLGPMVRPATRVVVFRGIIRGEGEEGLGDIGSSSNRLKWSTDPNDESQATCM